MVDDDNDANEDSAMVRHSGGGAHGDNDEDANEDLEEDDDVDVDAFVDFDEMDSDQYRTDPSVRRRRRVFKQFSTATRKLIHQIIEDQMGGFERRLRMSEKLVLDRNEQLEDCEQQLENDSFQLSDRETAVSNREAAVAVREQQIASEWEQMQAIKLGLAALLNGKSEPMAKIDVDASGAGS